MEDRIEELYSYIQGHCLWQFFAREWDRKANIENIMDKTSELLSGKQICPETPLDRYFYAEAKSLTTVIKDKFHWLIEMDEEQRKAVMEGVKKRLVEVFISKSLNPELRAPGY